MTKEEALRIVEIYHYNQGAEDVLGMVCTNPYYLEAKKLIDEAIRVLLEEN